jgi:hypothetical protein
MGVLQTTHKVPVGTLSFSRSLHPGTRLSWPRTQKLSVPFTPIVGISDPQPQAQGFVSASLIASALAFSDAVFAIAAAIFGLFFSPAVRFACASGV